MKYILVAILLSMTFIAYGQEKDVEIVVNLKDDDTGKKLSGATVSVYADGELISSGTSGGNGKVPAIYVLTGKYYQIFIRKNGYVTKMAELDARIDILEDAPDPMFLRFETALFESVDGVDFSFLETTAMTRFDFDSEYFYRFDEDYTRDMLQKIEELKKKLAEKKKEEEEKEKELKKTEADFQAYVEAGDKAVGETAYQKAIEQYGLAVGLRPDNAEVKAKLAEAQRLLEEQKKLEAAEAQYKAKMAEAATAYKDEKLEDAINLYTEASALKQSEQEPKDKIAEIRKIIADKKAMDEKILTLVKAGDLSVSAEAYEDAIAKYTEAYGLRADEEVKKKLEDAKKLKEDREKAAEEEKQKLAQYNALLESGAELLTKEDLQDARKKYAEASALMPEEILPQKKLEEIDGLLAEQEAKEAEMKAFKAKMEEAETAYNNKEWETALVLYGEAEKLMPLVQEPKDKIKEIKEIIAKEKEAKEQYAKFIQEGDQFASTESYEEAVTKYELARAIDETDEVTQKIKEANDAMQAMLDAMQEAQKLEAEYAALITQADGERDKDEIEAAIASYTEAQKLKEEEPYPAAEIEKLNKILEDRKAEAEAAAKAEAEYQAIIDAGNKAFEAEDWAESKNQFTKANAQKGDDPYPIEKLKEIESKLKALEELAALNEAYQAAIEAGNEAFAAESYEKAIEGFTKAKEIKPDETEPQLKIDEINNILASLKNEAEKEAAYQAAMNAGKAFAESEAYFKAKDEFQKALSLKNEDENAKAEIARVTAILKDLADAAATEKAFNTLVAEGDAAFETETYQAAKDKYTEALTLMASDEVTEKIKACDAKLSEMDAAAAQKAAFDALLKEADDKFKAEEWQASITKYEAAKAIESTDYITAQIKAANEQLALLEKDQETAQKAEALVKEGLDFEAKEMYAPALKSFKDAYALRPKPELEENIKRLEKVMAEQEAAANADANYQAKLAEADAAFVKKDYAEAIDLYEQAQSIKSTETYPAAQIEICKDEIAKLNEKENLVEYNGVIAKADQLFSEQKFDLAIAQYETAKLILPSKTYPEEKIKEIRSIRDKLANAEADKLKKENDYKALVASADTKFETQNYEEAISLYKDAQKIKAFDAYVVDKLKKAEEKLTAINAAKAAAQKYQSFVDKADDLMKQEKWKAAIADYNNALLYDRSNDYPKTQIALAEKAIENEGKALSENAYSELLADAQAKMDQKEYETALTLYKSAFKQRPTDNVPADKIRELNELIAQQNALSSAKNKYQSLIDKADNLFEKKDWKKARVYYVEAYNLTNDDYPDSKIKEIDNINNKFSSDQYSRMIDKADEYFRDENYEKAKGLYNRAVKTFTSQNSDYPQEQIKKINAILNPPALLANGDKKPVGEKVNLTEAEIQKLFTESEAANKNTENTKVLSAGNSVNELSRNWQSGEVNASYRALDSMSVQQTRITAEEEVVEQLRQNNEVQTTNIAEKITDAQRFENEYGENVSFRQMQVVENIDQSQTTISSTNDLAREEYEPIVQEMQTEYKTEQLAQNGTQNNMLFSQVSQIETIQVEQNSTFNNADIPRTNTELDVENFYINVVNENNKDAWNQEDQVFSTVKAKEKMESENFASTEYSDVPRQKMENIVVETGTNFQDLRRESEKIHDDFSNSTNDAVNDLKLNIFEANKDADQGRLAMEQIDEDVSVLLSDAQKAQAERNQLQVELTDVSISELKAEESATHQNKENKLFEDTETINKQIDKVKKTAVNNSDISENNMHLATGFVESATKKIGSNASSASEVAENSSDEIIFNQSLMADEKRKVTKSSEVTRTKTEDKVTSLRDIDVKSVTQAVKNELGTKYPEGVTEEVYQQKDEDGYLLSYVIRRVVVKDGEGNIFEKSQMKHGISYTKNGQAISEYTWQDQTEDATLTYH